jgi:hypothetical protein
VRAAALRALERVGALDPAAPLHRARVAEPARASDPAELEALRTGLADPSARSGTPPPPRSAAASASTRRPIPRPSFTMYTATSRTARSGTSWRQVIAGPSPVLLGQLAARPT